MKLIKNNLRQFPRSRFHSPQAGTIYVDGEEYQVTLLDYGFYGLGLNVNPEVLKSLQDRSYGIELQVDQLKVSGRVRYFRSQMQGSQIGFEVQYQLGSTGQRMQESSWDFVQDRKTVDELLSDVCFKGPECLIYVKQISGLAQVVPIQINNDVLICEVFGVDRGRLSNEQANFRFDLFQTAYTFDASVISQEGNFINIQKPKMLARLLARETQRVSFTDAHHNLIEGVEIYSRLFDTKVGETLELIDYSEKGLCFLDKSLKLHAPRGTLLEQIKLFRRDGEVISGKGVICSYRYLKNHNAFAVGISFETNEKKDRELWHNTILKARYPTLTFNYDLTGDHKRIWQLFERSGYLNIKGEDSYTHTIDLTKKTWEKLADAGTKWSKRALVRKEDDVVGHIQMDQIYPGTWFIHHLAVDTAVPVTIARDLLTLITDVLGAEGGNYVINYTDAEKKWNQKNYYEFVESYVEPGHNLIDSYTTYTFNIDRFREKKQWRTSKCPDWTVRNSNEYDKKRIRRFIELNYSHIEKSALALDDLFLESFNKDISKYGLSRKRAFVVAYEGRKFLGFGIVEMGSEGLNIVGVLDLLFVNISSDLSMEQKRLVQKEIIKKASEIYADNGKTQFLMQLDPEYTKFEDEDFLSYMCETKRWISSRDVFPRFQSHTSFVYGHLQTRREKIRKKIKK